MSVESPIDPSTSPSLDRCLAEGRRILGRAARELPGSDVHPREALLLLAAASGLDRAQVLARGERVLDGATAETYGRMLARRAAGSPVAYILGKKEFYGREMAVDARVLIPRPETEHLVEAALARAARFRGSPEPRILDVGTGSGCIAVTLACELESIRITATDVSLPALQVARSNARRWEVEERVRFVAADLASGLRLGDFQMVVSNPPYVAREAADEMSPEVRDHEPHRALFADDGGRKLISGLLDAAVDLPPAAPLLLEIGWDQGAWVETETQKRPWLEWQELIYDYGGRGRIAALARSSEERS